MPSPLGHSLMGYIIYRAGKRPKGAHQWRLLPLYVFAANAPDLDFLPGLFAGDLGRFHHGPSHSIASAILFGLLVCTFLSRRLYPFVMGSSTYLSHIILDYFIQDPSPPHGVPIFWPVDHEYYMAPIAFFRPFNYPSNPAELTIPLFFTIHNLLTMVTEIAYLIPVLILVLYCGKSGMRLNISFGRHPRSQRGFRGDH